MDAAAAVLSVQSGRIPAARNTTQAVEGARLNVSREVREQPVNVSVSSVYSLGGQNAALVFKRA